ncbi:MAG: serine/threonine-protein kinase [Myxococcota bacterium]
MRFQVHSLGIVHRDLKPQNLMITRQGYRRNAMVLDFGIAAVMANSRDPAYKTLTHGSQIHGTPSYMAPEQLRDRRLTPQIDIYAWGLVFVECLTGRRVVVGETPLDIAMQQVAPSPIPLPDGLDDGIRHILTRALAKSLEARYASAIDVLADLEAYDTLYASGNFSSLGSSPSLPSMSNDLANTNPSAPNTGELSETKVFQGDINRALASIRSTGSGELDLPSDEGLRPSPMGIHSSLPSISFDVDPTPNPTLDSHALGALGGGGPMELGLAVDEPTLGAEDPLHDGPAALGLSRPGTLASSSSQIAVSRPDTDSNPTASGAHHPTSPSEDGPSVTKPSQDELYNQRILMAIAILLVLVVLLLIWIIIR